MRKVDDRVVGGYKNGFREGRGIWLSAKGDSYEGEWKNGWRDDEGVAEYDLGGRIEGSWSRGKPAVTNTVTLALNGTVPFEKTYADMTPQQQQQFRRHYPMLHPDDTPPYPAKGTARAAQGNHVRTEILACAVQRQALRHALSVRNQVHAERKRRTLKQQGFSRPAEPGCCK